MKNLCRLSVSKNINSQTIASRDGRLLCSPNNPFKEAKAWLKNQKLTLDDTKVLVLGAGVAHHVYELIEKFPQITIDVLELDEETNELYLKSSELLKRTSVYKNKEDVINKTYDAILSFRPSWVGFESEYLLIYLMMTQRDLKSELAFKLNSLDFAENQSHLAEVKIWKTLRELIR
jgi:hypothetical protein